MCESTEYSFSVDTTHYGQERSRCCRKNEAGKPMQCVRQGKPFDIGNGDYAENALCVVVAEAVTTTTTTPKPTPPPLVKSLGHAIVTLITNSI